MSRDDNGWKPGPPPLDKPGRYDCVIVQDFRRSPTLARRLVIVTPLGSRKLDGGSTVGRDYFNRIGWHFPIPEPPAPPLSESSDAPK
jgi:hypothetical protein